MSGGDSVTFVGRVKWFNNKSGFGFVTVVSEGEHNNTDVFVHHSAIHVGIEQYKYLVQGEYVSFGMTRVEEGEHEWQASNVTGLYGGYLMCETRNEARSHRDGDEDGGEPQRSERTRRPPRVRVQGGGPREGEQWTLIRTASTPGRGRRSGSRPTREPSTH